MKRIVRLTESDLSRIVRRVIRESERNYIFEAYEPGTTFTVSGVDYTIQGVGGMGPNGQSCYFTIQFTGGGKSYDMNKNSINKLPDGAFKSTLVTIMNTKMKQYGC